MESGMNFIAGVLISFAIWLPITVIIGLLSYCNGWTHNEDELDWSNGFDAGWDEHKKLWGDEENQ